MTHKKCNTCFKKKEIKHFYKLQVSPDGYANKCKQCKVEGKKIPREYKKPLFNKKFEQDDISHYSLDAPKKQDYLMMYEILKKIGYDITKDIHSQFLTRHNKNLKVPMKYKRRLKYSLNRFDVNGDPINERTPTKKSEGSY